MGKRNTGESALAIAAALPDALPLEIRHEAFRLCRDSLGGDFLIFKRALSDDDHTPQWWDDTPAPRYYVADCRCTACGGRFQTGYAPGGKRGRRDSPLSPGIIYAQGEDGVCYVGPMEEDSEFAVIVRAGDDTNCPDCGKPVAVRRVSYFRNPKTYRVLFAKVENVGTLTAIVYWMLSRTLSADADAQTQAAPFRAVVLSGGTLRHFRWLSDLGIWKPASAVEPSCVAYVSSDGGTSTHQKVGAFVSRRVPDLAGTSAEKSGLAEYIQSATEGGFPVSYLKFWLKYPAVENVVKAGWGYTVDCAIRQSFFQISRTLAVPHALESLCDWNQRSPAKLLRMTKTEVRAYGPRNWTNDTLKLWLGMSRRGVFLPGDVAAFTATLSRYSWSSLLQFEALCDGGKPFDVGKVNRYLTKQHDKFQLDYAAGFEMLCDYRKMFAQINPGVTPTQIELWPPDLRTAHNRLIQQSFVLRDKIKAGRYLKVYEQWKGLEYSDGEICAKLPLSQADLIHEGHTLNHCVASYGESHCSGALIIFIRHARRPERPWFTLNVSVNGAVPIELQLHGYGNEHANGKRLRIPQRVRDFCDNWEKNVLTPVFRAVRAKETRP